MISPAQVNPQIGPGVAFPGPEVNGILPFAKTTGNKQVPGQANIKCHVNWQRDLLPCPVKRIEFE